MLKFENPTNGRYYYLTTDKDMLNAKLLIIIRGGNTRRRIVNRIAYDSELDLREAIAKLSKRRLKRGYLLIN